MEYLVIGIKKISLLFGGKKSCIFTLSRKILDQHRPQHEKKAITLIPAQGISYTARQMQGRAFTQNHSSEKEGLALYRSP